MDLKKLLRRKPVLKKTVDINPVDLVEFLLIKEKDIDEDTAERLAKYRKLCDYDVEFELILEEDDFIVTSNGKTSG